MAGYTWSISNGGEFIAGQGTPQVQVVWHSSGPQSVGVNYLTPEGCTLPEPVILDLTVNSAPGLCGNIEGNSSVCLGANSIQYGILPVFNATSYEWTLPQGVSLVSGSGTDTITVDFTVDALSGVFSVVPLNDCGYGLPSPDFPVTVSLLPGPAGTITGQDTVCQGDQQVLFRISEVAHATSYFWTLPPGVSPAAGAYSAEILLNFSDTAQSGTISVVASNACGEGPASTELTVLVENCSGTSEDPGYLIKIYPNPTHDILRIQFPDGGSGMLADVIIRDILGKEVLSTVFNAGGTHELSTGNLQSGLYVLTISTKGRTINRKVIRQ